MPARGKGRPEPRRRQPVSSHSPIPASTAAKAAVSPTATVFVGAAASKGDGLERQVQGAAKLEPEQDLRAEEEHSRLSRAILTFLDNSMR